MLRLAGMFYIIIAPTLAGIFVTATLVVPELMDALGIPLAAAIGAVLGVPFAWFVARAIKSQAKTL